MKHHLFPFLGFFLLPLVLKAQENLVLNASVETVAFKQPQSWVIMGSVDFYRSQSLQISGTRTKDEPQYPAAASGLNYLGIRAFEAGTEIAIARFKQPMEADQWYRISCFARIPASDCTIDMGSISVYPCDSILSTKYWYGARPQIPFTDLQTKEKGGLVTPREWTEVFAYYKSHGGENFLWVGDFSYPDNSTDTTHEALKNAKDVLKCLSHFYCDSFVVERCLPPDQSRFTVHNITFNSGSYSITSVGDPILTYLVKYLHDFPAVKIRVEGHTDNDGSEQFNLALSQKRAAVVKNWLVAQGVQAARISTTGYGKSKPLGPQVSEAQKALNRRVEIILIPE